MEPASAPSGPKANPDDEVVFTKYGDRYVPKEIWDAAERSGLEPIPAANHDGPGDAHQRAPHHAA